MTKFNNFANKPTQDLVFMIIRFIFDAIKKRLTRKLNFGNSFAHIWL